MGKKRASGAEQIKASGRVAVLVALTPEEKEIIQKAAADSKQSMTAFIAFHAVKAARKIAGDKP